MTEQELRDEFDILSIEQKIEWALDTIRHKETFGMDELNASLSRERRAKGVLLDCKETIKAKDAEIAEARELVSKANFKFLTQDETEFLEEKARAWLKNNC